MCMTSVGTDLYKVWVTCFYPPSSILNLAYIFKFSFPVPFPSQCLATHQTRQTQIISPITTRFEVVVFTGACVNSQQLENSGGLPLEIYLNLDALRLLLRQFFGRNDTSQSADDKHPNIHIYERLPVLSTMLYSTVFGFLIIFAWRRESCWEDEAHQEDSFTLFAAMSQVPTHGT